MGCGRAQGACECQARKDDECDAEASGRSSDAVWRRNPPVPFGLLRHGAICFVGSSRRSARLCVDLASLGRLASSARAPAYHMAPWR